VRVSRNRNVQRKYATLFRLKKPAN
jgi:hypothetical protein